jgi:uncharacterized HAD superfamily protein
MRIAIDLDNTVFDTTRMIRDICVRHNVDFTAMTIYDVYQCFPKNVADEIMRAFDSPELRQMPVLNKKIPKTLNYIINRPDTDVYFITERPIETASMDIEQLKNAGIMFDPHNIVHRKPKIGALRDYCIDLCFDDSPNIVCECIKHSIDVVMISNEDTPYNHHLRGRVEYYPDLMTALAQRGMIQK